MSVYEELASQLGIDTSDPTTTLAHDLVEADDQLLEDLVALRKASGLKAADVARRIGRDRSAVTQFEKLTADPRLSTIRRYALAIGARITHKVEKVAECAPEVTPDSDRPATAPDVAFIANAYVVYSDASRVVEQRPHCTYHHALSSFLDGWGTLQMHTSAPNANDASEEGCRA
ncbi:helix-turn-helix domain-containing protein [Nocardia rhizosphaerae]|uniref:Helix-turn-helix domain-containing protein n=1 Tax=Nocardia rhizosphaerae TaxID=1691571 RepID=A0ABV8L3V8_9NOCA